MENGHTADSAAQALRELPYDPVGEQERMQGKREAAGRGLERGGDPEDGRQSGLEQSLSSWNSDPGDRPRQDSAPGGTERVSPIACGSRPRSASVGSPTKPRRPAHMSDGRGMQAIIDSAYVRTGRLRDSLSVDAIELPKAVRGRGTHRSEWQAGASTSTARVAGVNEERGPDRVDTELQMQQGRAGDLFRQMCAWQQRALDLRQRLDERGANLASGIERSQQLANRGSTQTAGGWQARGAGGHTTSSGTPGDPGGRDDQGLRDADRQRAVYLASVHTSAPRGGQDNPMPMSARESGPEGGPSGTVYMGDNGSHQQTNTGPLGTVGTANPRHLEGRYERTRTQYTVGSSDERGRVGYPGRGDATLVHDPRSDHMTRHTDQSELRYDTRAYEHMSSAPEHGARAELGYRMQTQREQSETQPRPEYDSRERREYDNPQVYTHHQRSRLGDDTRLPVGQADRTHHEQITCPHNQDRQGSRHVSMQGATSVPDLSPLPAPTSASDTDLVAKSLAQMGGCFRSIWKQMEVADMAKFTGEVGTRDYHDWKVDVQRKCDEHYQDPSMQLALVQGACGGAACEFVNAHLKDRPDETVRGLLKAIQRRFCILDDEYHALAELEKATQHRNEIPGNFVERLRRLARIAYADDPSFRTSRHYEKIMIRHFVRGLASDEVKKYLISRDPEDLDDAVDFANRKVREIARRAQYGLGGESGKSSGSWELREGAPRTSERSSRRDSQRSRRGSSTSDSGPLQMVARSRRAVAGVAAARSPQSSESEGEVMPSYESSDEEIAGGICEVRHRSRTDSENRATAATRPIPAEGSGKVDAQTSDTKKSMPTATTPSGNPCQCQCKCWMNSRTRGRSPGDGGPQMRYPSDRVGERYPRQGSRPMESPGGASNWAGYRPGPTNGCYVCGGQGHWARDCPMRPRDGPPENRRYTPRRDPSPAMAGARKRITSEPKN